MKILITAFGPFDGFSVNPSETVLKMLKEHSELNQFFQLDSEVLDVSYDEIDKFIKQKASNHDVIIHLGVAANSPLMRFERIAKNVKSGKDIFNQNPINELIIADKEFIYSSFPLQILDEIIDNNISEVVYSDDAGSYLCNYLYFKSLDSFSVISHVLFVHIADVKYESRAVSLENQADILVTLLNNYYNMFQVKNNLC